MSKNNFKIQNKVTSCLYFCKILLHKQNFFSTSPYTNDGECSGHTWIDISASPYSLSQHSESALSCTVWELRLVIKN